MNKKAEPRQEQRRPPLSRTSSVSKIRASHRQPKHEPDPLPVTDPLAIYAEPTTVNHGPSTGTFMEAMRRFALNYKAQLYLILLVSIVGFWYISLRPSGPASIEGLLTGYFQRFSQNDPAARYRIRGTAVPDSEIAASFAVVSQLNPFAKQAGQAAFQRRQFENDLILYAALQNHQLQSEEAKLYLETVLRQAAADYVVLASMTEAQRRFDLNVSEPEILSVYRQNSDRYTKAGIDKEVALQSIRETMQAELMRKSSEFIAVRRAVMVKKIQEAVGASYREE